MNKKSVKLTIFCLLIQLNKGEKAEVKSPKASNDRGVVYLGHVPHGFYENEMKQYFSQFGHVTNINIPKSKVIYLFLLVT